MPIKAFKIKNKEHLLRRLQQKTDLIWFGGCVIRYNKCISAGGRFYKRKNFMRTGLKSKLVRSRIGKDLNYDQLEELNSFYSITSLFFQKKLPAFCRGLLIRANLLTPMLSFKNWFRGFSNLEKIGFWAALTSTWIVTFTLGHFILLGLVSVIIIVLFSELILLR